MKKKFYEQPQAKFIEVKLADIIATSPGGQIQSLEDDDEYEDLF